MISSYSNQELIDELAINRGFFVVTPDQSGARDILGFINTYLYPDEILKEMRREDVVDYLKDMNYVVIHSSDVDFKISALNIADNGSNLYKTECIDLFIELLEKNGADFVYALLEPHKTL